MDFYTYKPTPLQVICQYKGESHVINVDWVLAAAAAYIKPSPFKQFASPLLKGENMKKILILTILCVILAGCGPEQQMALQNLSQSFSQIQQQEQQQKMYDAQYNYYTRPYEDGNVTIHPRR